MKTNLEGNISLFQIEDLKICKKIGTNLGGYNSAISDGFFYNGFCLIFGCSDYPYIKITKSYKAICEVDSGRPKPANEISMNVTYFTDGNDFPDGAFPPSNTGIGKITIISSRRRRLLYDYAKKHKTRRRLQTDYKITRFISLATPAQWQIKDLSPLAKWFNDDANNPPPPLTTAVTESNYKITRFISLATPAQWQIKDLSPLAKWFNDDANNPPPPLVVSYCIMTNWVNSSSGCIDGKQNQTRQKDSSITQYGCVEQSTSREIDCVDDLCVSIDKMFAALENCNVQDATKHPTLKLTVHAGKWFKESFYVKNDVYDDCEEDDCTVENCMRRCKKMSGCKSFDYSLDGKACYFYNKAGTKEMLLKNSRHNHYVLN